MHLEKLVIQGFKSFANKNELVFPGMVSEGRRGITSIVGPNGSGKSNTADAIRWALGEQSIKALRGKKSEDVIFSGSDKKGRLGMAEVSLYLNNEDKKVPVDYAQLVLTRRLYRNGDSEYLLNNNRVRLSDIQIMLAKANFGQKTYSVIGQGLVEGFLNTSLAERKEFFDEATGVKQFQIKRDDSLNKLRNSYENLSQAQMLIAEIEPRLRSLTKQVSKLQKRGELEAELKEFQLVYYSELWHDINAKFSRYNSEFLELERAKQEKEKKIEKLNKDLARMEEKSGDNSEFDARRRELAAAQAEKDALNRRLAKIEARLEVNLEAGGNFDASFLSGRKSEIESELKKTETEARACVDGLRAEETRLKEQAGVKSVLDNKIAAFNRELLAAGSGAESGDIVRAGEKLKNAIARLEAFDNLADIAEIKNIINELKGELGEIMELMSGERNRTNIHDLQNKLIALAGEKEGIIARMNEIGLKAASLEERSRLIGERSSAFKAEIRSIDEKISAGRGARDVKGAAAEKESVKKELGAAEEKIGAIMEKINDFSRAEEEKRKQLFDAQRKIQELQVEANNINLKLSEVKTHSTRYETKLEDLEAEIRQNLRGLKEVRERKNESAVEVEPLRGKIESLKRQLELIGGIDSEVEKEYVETKERFDYLSGQVNDLLKAIDSLEKIIKELDITIKDRFDKEFKVISKKFEEYFKILFSGGAAKIVKVLENEKGEEDKESKGPSAAADEDKEAADSAVDLKRIKFLQKHNATGLAGIEIQATPPGKKIQSIAMLSGGERALTAIALICAIISANPSPFVVLDEVDAALDEANSERLAKILDDLSHKTQFITITHNRATMRRAAILYGVTMGDDGVSKILSVKLEEAKKN